LRDYALGALIGGVVLGLFALVPAGVLEGISDLFELAECCSIFAVFGVTTVATLSTFLIGHSLLMAGLAGVSTMTVLQVALSAAVSLQNVR
jgi:hypothetical protein